MTGIALGDFKTRSEAKDKENSHKRRLKEVIKLNKLKVNPSRFKFDIEKQKGYPWNHSDGKLQYPYNLSVETSNSEYNWIFET